MLDERIAEMIQADVDGELPAAERSELESVLEQSAEARCFREEMVRIARMISELPPAEPPQGLTRQIIGRIELPARTRWMAWTSALLQPASYGAAVAAGVLLALGLTQIRSPGPDDIESLVGSMVRQDQAAQISRAAAGRLHIALPEVEGDVVLKSLDENAWAMEFAIESADPVELTLDLAGSGLRFGGFVDPAAGVGAIQVSGGEVRMMTEGRHQFVVFLRHSEGAESTAQVIGVVLSQHGESLYQGRLNTGGTDA